MRDFDNFDRTKLKFYGPKPKDHVETYRLMSRVRGSLVYQAKRSLRNATRVRGQKLQVRSPTRKNFGRGRVVFDRNNYVSRWQLQQTIVKTDVKKSNEMTLRRMKRFIWYLQKETKSLDGEIGIFYNEDRKGVGGFKFAEELMKDRHHFRIILSPDNGRKMDLTEHTREVMKQLEKDLGTNLQWMAVNHYDGKKPHVHIIVRGKTERNRDLVINPKYISHGMRMRAQEFATLELGPRTNREIAKHMKKDKKRKKKLEKKKTKKRTLGMEI